MNRIIIVIVLLTALHCNCRAQVSYNNKLLGKWKAYKMVDSVDFGSLNLESIDSFKISLKESVKKYHDLLKMPPLDTIVDEDKKFQTFVGYMLVYYHLFHDSWIEFCSDSTLIEHIRGDIDWNGKRGRARNLKRTFEFNALTNMLIMDKHGATEKVRVSFLSSDTILLSFIADDLHLIEKRVE